MIMSGEGKEKNMPYWTYTIKDSSKGTVAENTSTFQCEKDARFSAVQDMKSLLASVKKKDPAVEGVSLPFFLTLTVHSPAFSSVMGTERYSAEEVTGYGKGKVLSFGELLTIAKENYAEGGDTVYECWNQSFFDDYVREAGPVYRKDVKSLFIRY